MNKFFKRLWHFAKVTAGDLTDKFLRNQLKRGKGSASRLHRALSAPPHLEGCSSRILIQPTPLPLHKPQFFLDGVAEEKYLEKLARYGRKITTPAGIISADRVEVSFPVGMHRWNGKLLEEAVLGEIILANAKYVLDLETIPLRRKTNFSEAILLSLPWHHNIFHWMIEILPRLLLYDLSEDLHHLKLVAPKSSPRFVRESLRLTGYEDRVCFVEDGVYRFEKLHILSRLSTTADVSPFAIEWLNRKMKKSKVGTSKKRIYVSRADAKIRFVVNEQEVLDILSDFGFETVTMSQYPLEKQIEIFQQAEIVVGSHGAAFSHVAFMEPGATFIEFFESGHINQCYYRIASLKNLKYGFLVCQKKGFGFSVDTAKLKSLLQQALPGLPSLRAELTI